MGCKVTKTVDSNYNAETRLLEHSIDGRPTLPQLLLDSGDYYKVLYVHL
jgi:hypothetical protein